MVNSGLTTHAVCTGGDDRSTGQEGGCDVPPLSKRIKLGAIQPPPPASLFSTPANTHSYGQRRGPLSGEGSNGGIIICTSTYFIVYVLWTLM